MEATHEGKLTEEQIHELLVEYQAAKDVQVRDKVILQYKSLVESIARRFTGSGEPLDDLVQEGYVGLINATDLYNVEKGVKFSTYATHFIIGQIKHALRDRGKIIKEPAWLQELNHRMTKVIDSLYQELGRQPTNAEIGRIMHLPEETVGELLTTREVFKVASLDWDQYDSPGGVVDADKVKDDRYTAFQLPVEDKVVLEMAVNKLKLMEQKVIQEFYYNGLSQTEIAKKLGISYNYVSHILRSGTRKLRRILTTEEVRDLQIQLQLASRRSEALAAEAVEEVVDSLTGLYNRGYIEDRLEEELTRAARDKSEVVFAIISICGMEDYGRKFGAMRRDDALCDLARVVRDSLRKCDVVGRIGDSEFGLILLYTDGHANVVYDRVREAIRQVGVEAASGSRRFESDIGHAAYPTDGANAADLISAAGKSLERAQRAKRRQAA